MTQQDDITQRVLTGDEINTAIDWPAANTTMRAENDRAMAREVEAAVLRKLSKLRAPVTDAGNWQQYRLRGSDENAEQVIERERRAYADLLQSVMDKRRDQASAPVAGEAVAHAVIAYGRIQRIVANEESAHEHAEQHSLNAEAAGWNAKAHVRPLVYGDAAPQAGAEDVRNAALEEAAVLVGGHTWAGASKIVSDLIAEHIRALKTQADKDGGQQRAGDGKTREALSWYAEKVAGCRKFGPDGEAARHALDRDGGQLARAALSATQAEQGERDAG